jgi:hypothetical protein
LRQTVEAFILYFAVFPYSASSVVCFGVQDVANERSRRRSPPFAVFVDAFIARRRDRYRRQIQT